MVVFRQGLSLETSLNFPKEFCLYLSQIKECSMSDLQITSPSNNAGFDRQKPATFKGTATNGIVTVQLLADGKYDLGRDDVDASGFWAITYPGFNQAGNRQITVIGFDKDNQRQEVVSIDIVVSAPDFQLGIDVSNYDGNVVWRKVKQAGYAFVFVKATEGLTFKDQYFPTNWAGIKQVGIIRGAYHFFRPAKDAKQQAENFLSYVGEIEDDDLPPVLDLEHYPASVENEWKNITKAQRIKVIKAWLETVESATQRKSIIYTSQGFWGSYLDGVKDFADHPLWVAHYTSKPQPTQPDEWAEWAFWQYTDKGEVPGIAESQEDLDRFNGSYSDLLEFIKSTKL